MKHGDILRVPVGGTITASATTDGTALVPDEITTYSSIDFTPAEYGCARAISRQTVDELQFDVLADVTRQIGRALAQVEDATILSTMGANTPATNQNAVYSGTGNTAIADLADGDLITVDDFADAVTADRVDDYQPDVAFIHPTQENIFIKDGQFVNAAEYGSADVVKKGELGTYLGVKIVSTTNVLASTAGSAGHNSLVFDSADAAGIAVKRNATIETKYEPLDRCHYIAGTNSWNVQLIQPKASCVIYSTDA